MRSCCIGRHFRITDIGRNPMIRPIKTHPVTWILSWAEVQEPCPLEHTCILPTLLFLSFTPASANSQKIAAHELSRELDQRRAERLVHRLIGEHGAPDLLLIEEAEEWDPAAWENLARDQQIEIGYFPAKDTHETPDEARIALRQIHELAQQLSTRFRSVVNLGDPTTSRLVARQLAEGAVYLQSPAKRAAVLAKAIELDKDCLPALVALGDHEFQRGDLNNALKYFTQGASIDRPSLPPGDPKWWADKETRPHLRALFGRILANWHLGSYAEAAAEAESLLALNPRDNQGIRFLLPLLHQLNDQHDAALKFYREYEIRYRGDFNEPAFLFGWAYALAREDDESGAFNRYRAAMLRNIYIAPMLLDLPEPRPDIWHPNDRSEPEYATEFCDSFASLWDRDAAARRFLQECYEKVKTEVARIIDLRLKMADFQDQRYEPEHESIWQKFIEEERALLGDLPDKESCEKQA